MAQKEISKPPRSSGSFFKVPSRALHKLSKSTKASGTKLLTPGKTKNKQNAQNLSSGTDNGYDNVSNSNSMKRSIKSGYSSTVESLRTGNRSLKSESACSSSANIKKSGGGYEIDEKYNPEAISSGAETCRSQVSYESSNQEQNPVPRSSGPVDIDSGEIVSEEKALFGKGNIYLQNGEYEKAIETFYQILRNHSKEPSQLLASIYYNIGVSQTKIQSFSKALDAFHNSVRIYKKCELTTHPNLAMTFVRLGFLHLESVKNYRKSLQAFHEALKIREIVYGRRHPLTAKIHNNLGVAYHHRKKYNRAKEHFQYALDTQRYILAQLSQDPTNKNIQRANLEVANTLDNLGSLVIDDVHSADSADRKAAMEAMEEAYQIRLQKYGEGHPVVASTYEKLEMVKKLDSGLIPNAPNISRRNPSIGESANTPIGNYSADTSAKMKSYSPPPPSSTPNTPYSKSSIPSNRNGTNESINFDTSDDLIKSKNLLFVRPLEDGLNNLCHTPGKGEGTSELLNDVQDDVKLMYEKACSSFKAGDYDESLELYNSFLNSLRSDSSETNPLAGMAWHDIGIIHLREERFPDALLAFQRAVEIKRETLGNDHPDVAVSIVKVGIAQLKQDAYDLALESFDEALAMRSKFLGDLHPSTARIYNNIGCIHVHASRMSDARVAYEHALDIQRSAMGESNDKALVLESAMTLINLGILYRHQKLWKDAEVVLWEAYRLQRNVLGPNHMTVLSTLDAIADIMAWNNDAESALKYYKTVLRILRNHHRTSPRTRPACLLLYKMHRIYVSQNNIGAAWKCLSEARVLSKQSPELDERSYALEKRIASEMEKMEEQGNICMTGSRQRDVNNTDIKPKAPSISVDNNISPVLSNGDSETEKIKEQSNIHMDGSRQRDALNDTDIAITPPTVKDDFPSSSVEKSNEPSKRVEKELPNSEVDNCKSSTNNILEFSDAEESVKSSENSVQDQECNDYTESDKVGALQTMNKIKAEPHKVILNTNNEVPSDSCLENSRSANVKSVDSCIDISKFEKPCSFHSEHTTLDDSDTKNEEECLGNILNESIKFDTEASKDRAPFSSKADIDAAVPDESIITKHVSSTTSSISSESNSDNKPFIKAVATSKYRSRMEALLANCATGNTTAVIDTNDSNSAASGSSFEAEETPSVEDNIEIQKVVPPLQEHQSEFKSRLQSMISNRPGTNAARPWARTSEQDNNTARPWARLSQHDKPDDDSEDSDPLNDYSFLTNRYIDSTDESEDNSDTLNNKESNSKSLIPESTNKFVKLDSFAVRSSSNNDMDLTKVPKVSFAPDPISDATHDSELPHDYESLKTEFDMLAGPGQQPNDYVSLKNEFDQLESGFSHRTVIAKTKQSCSIKNENNMGNSKSKFRNVESLFASRVVTKNGETTSDENSIHKLHNSDKATSNLNSSDQKPQKNFGKLEALFANRSGKVGIENEDKKISGAKQSSSNKSPLDDNKTNNLDPPISKSSGKKAKNKFGNLEAMFAARSGKSKADDKTSSTSKQSDPKEPYLTPPISTSLDKKPKNKFGNLESMFAARSKKPKDDDGDEPSKSKHSDPEETSNLREIQSSDIPLKDDPKFAKYFKMLKVGMPKETVKHSMITDGLDPATIDGDPNLPAEAKEIKKEIALKDDPKFAKYFKMLKVGMPKETVKHSMIRDGLDPATIDGDPNLPAKSKETEKEIALKDDPRFIKYFKMLKVGMPCGAVKNSMTRDGYDPNILDGDPNLPAAISKKSSESSKVVPKKKSRRRTRLHWDSMRDEVKSGSVWALVKDDLDISLHINDSEIKELFEADIKSPKRLNKSSTAEAKDQGSVLNGDQTSKRGNMQKKKSSVKVIDPKRANNGGISLARIKISFDEMARVINKMEKSSLSQQQFESILEYLPTFEEVKSLNKFLNSANEGERIELISTLCECEKFMVAMMDVQNVEKKIRALLFRLQFDTVFTELERDAALIDDACDELSNSLRLRKLLGIVLNVGNRLNMEAASAFSITSLQKLNQTKSMNKKITILHYVVTVARRNDQSLLYFKEDLPSVFKSEKIFWDHCLNGAKELEAQLTNVIKLILKSTSSTAVNLDLCNFSMEEMELLSSTYVGQFVLDAVLKIKVLKQQIDTTNESYAQLLHHFQEESLQPHEFFNVIVQFSRTFDSAKADVEADEKAKKRGKKSVIKPLTSLVLSSSKSSNGSRSGSEGDVSEQTVVQLKQAASQSFNSVLSELKSKASLKTTNCEVIEAGISEC